MILIKRGNGGMRKILDVEHLEKELPKKEWTID